MKNDDFKAAMELSCFLYNREDDGNTNAESVVYYDSNGVRYEHQVSKQVVEEAMGKVDSKPKAIARTSGGIIRCQPIKLLVYSPVPVKTQGSPELRVRVRFLDFLRESDTPLNEEKYAVLTKDVLPKEVLNDFNYALEDKKRWVIDFGFGIVPVFVFDYKRDSAGHVMALFTHLSDVKALTRGEMGKETEVQCYKASRSVLRITNELEYEMALRRSKQLSEARERVIPPCLKFGKPMLLPQGFPEHILTGIMSRSISPANKKETDTKQDDIFAYMEGV